MWVLSSPYISTQCYPQHLKFNKDGFNFMNKTALVMIIEIRLSSLTAMVTSILMSP